MHEGGKVSVLCCDETEAKIAKKQFLKEDRAFQIPVFTFVLLWKPITFIENGNCKICFSHITKEVMIYR